MNWLDAGAHSHLAGRYTLPRAPARAKRGQRWLKLQRVGSVFTASVSTDGANWTPVNTNTLTSIATRLYVGAFTYAASSQNPNVHSVSFDSVSLTGDVVGPPGVSISPTSETAYTRQSATFTALPSGKPPFGYQWQLNGAAIAGATTNTLMLTNLQPTNSGLVRVALTNASGSVTSAVATRTVLTPPAYFAQALAASPLAYWRLNDAGPTAADSVGTFDGTGQGAILFGAAGISAPFSGFEPGNLAAQFNGTDSSVAIPALSQSARRGALRFRQRHERGGEHHDLGPHAAGHRVRRGHFRRQPRLPIHRYCGPALPR